MKTKIGSTHAAIVVAVLSAFPVVCAFGQSQSVDSRIGELKFTHDFAGGYPTKETVEKLYDERDFQRACQAYLWAIPAVSFAEWQHGHASFGAGYGDIAALLSYDDRLGVLTPNATTPYYLVFSDLTAGPVVISMPPNVRGGLSDGWQQALPDTNKSAKYLVLGPGQEAPADTAGFEVRHCPTSNMFVGIRITVTDPKEAAALLAQFRAYPYAQRANPPAPKIVSPQGKAWTGMPPRGMAYWQRLNDVIQREPVAERDRFFHEMLKPLGIEKGKPFSPDARQTKILTEAALVGEAMARANTFRTPLRGSDVPPRTAIGILPCNSTPTPRTTSGISSISAPPGSTKPSAPVPTWPPSTRALSSAYLGAYTDKSGEWLDGGRSYRLQHPAGCAGEAVLVGHALRRGHALAPGQHAEDRRPFVADGFEEERRWFGGYLLRS
jgi:hypothetical protein